MDGMDPMEVPLLNVAFWVQVHSLPMRLFSEAMAKQFGNFIGEFMEYDTKRVVVGFKNFVHIRVLLDIRQPLKRKKKLIIAEK